jgi:tetratricopeptide (TPR) repeat protein
MWSKRATDDGRWVLSLRRMDNRKDIVHRPSSIVFILVILALLGLFSLPKVSDTLAINSLATAAAIRCGSSRNIVTQEQVGSTFAKSEQVAWLQAVEARCDGLDDKAIAAMHDTLDVSDARLSMVRTFYPDNVELARFATERYPTRAEAWFWLGDALSMDGDSQGAIEQYERGLEFAPTEASAWMSLGSLYQEQSNLQEAVKAYDQACIYVDNLKNGCRQAGKLYLKMGQYELAEKRFKEAIRQLGDTWVPLERDLAAALLAQGRTEEAVPHLEILAKHGSEDAREKLNQIRNK